MMRPYRFLVCACMLINVQCFSADLAVLCGDVGAGVFAAAGAAPLISAVDRAITLNSAGKQELWSALHDIIDEMVQHPIQMLRSTPFLWLWFVYASTYIAANSMDTISVSNNLNPVFAVLAVSTIVNSAACLAKDAAFVKMFGVEVNKPVPLQSYMLWLGRDGITMFSAFALPSLLLTCNVPSIVSSFAGPIVAQCFCAPLHLAGLALYNLPSGSNYAATVQQQFPATVLAKQLRILPAFSLGGIVNSNLRDMAHELLAHTTTISSGLLIQADLLTQTASNIP
jgi:hypothetical protein